MTVAVDARPRVVVLATAVFVLVTAAVRSEVARELPNPFSGDGPPTASFPGEVVTAFDGGAIASVPADVVPASDRPVVAGGAKRADGQRAPSLAPTAAASATTSVPLAWDVPLHGSLTTVGPVALGLSRRGPPTPADR